MRCPFERQRLRPVNLPSQSVETHDPHFNDSLVSTPAKSGFFPYLLSRSFAGDTREGAASDYQHPARVQKTRLKTGRTGIRD